MKSEYISLLITYQEVIHLTHLVQELIPDKLNNVVINDNQSGIALVKNPVKYAKSKALFTPHILTQVCPGLVLIVV